MALNFPDNPTLYQVYSEGNRAWTWNGRYWQATSVTAGYTGSQGYTGSVGIGYTGSQGDLGYTGSQGEIGYAGSRGFTGEQGVQGERGLVGFTGSKGDNSTGQLTITDHTINGTVVNRNITINPLGTGQVVTNARFLPAGNSAIGLGDTGRRWQNIYVDMVLFADGTFQTSTKTLVGGTPPTTSRGRPGDKANTIAFDVNYLYYCFANYDGTTDVWRRMPWQSGTW